MVPWEIRMAQNMVGQLLKEDVVGPGFPLEPVVEGAVALMGLHAHKAGPGQHRLCGIGVDARQLPSVEHQAVMKAQAVENRDQLPPHGLVAGPGAAPAVNRTEGQQIAQAVLQIPDEEILHLFQLLGHIDGVAAAHQDAVVRPVYYAGDHGCFGVCADLQGQGLLSAGLSCLHRKHMEARLLQQDGFRRG